jgi:Flp pilus assembly protein TadG
MRRLSSLITAGWASGRERGDDSGVAFVEFLLAIPFLMIMVFGVVETGLGWRAVVQVHSAVRGGARVASRDGKNASADFDTLTAIAAALPADMRDSASGIKIVIFNAGSGTGTVPNDCLTASTATPMQAHGINDSCNVYDWNNLTAANLVLTNFGCGATSVDSMWCPGNRHVNLSTDDIDYIGVYIETVHHNQTHTYFGDFKIARQVVFRLEPALGS